MVTMRKTVAVLVVLAAAVFVGNGSFAASKAPVSSSGAQAVTVSKGLAIPINRAGTYTEVVTTAPGLSATASTVSSAFGVHGGTVDFSAPAHTVMTDSTGGLVVSVTFSVRSFTGSPMLVMEGATISPL